MGLALKLFSTRREDKWAAVAGATWYPQNKVQPFGVDIGAGYVFDNAVVSVGWDFLHSPQIGVGVMNTKEDRQSVSPTPPAPGGGGE